MPTAPLTSRTTRRWTLPAIAGIVAICLTSCGSTSATATSAVRSASTPTATTPAGPDADADRASITAALNAWPGAWADRDATAVCGLFAPDAVFTFQGGDDRSFAQACAQFSELVGSPDKTVSYRPPDVESIVVDGDLAAVRLIWTATITAADGTVLETSKEKGLDVFQRQSDGSWRITVSYAFPLS